MLFPNVPDEVNMKIMMYNPHPVAELFMKELKPVIDKKRHHPFARYFFLKKSAFTAHVYMYTNMDQAFYMTLAEYHGIRLKELWTYDVEGYP